MRVVLALFAHALATLGKLLGPGGVKTVVAENLLLRHQLLIITRPGKRAPNLRASQRLLLGFLSLFRNPRRLLRNAIILKAATLLRFHREFNAPSACGLNPGRADAVAYLASGYIRRHGDDLAHWLVAKDSRKLSRKMSKRLMHIGVADTAGVHLHQHLT